MHACVFVLMRRTPNPVSLTAHTCIPIGFKLLIHVKKDEATEIYMFRFVSGGPGFGEWSFILQELFLVCYLANW